MLEHLVGFFIFLSLILYALLAGADFGGGMWDLLAFGPRAERQRKAIAEAIGPIWEANHVWIILVVVLLFNGFPPAFAKMMIALHIPLTLMLIGIVLRGSAFIFRKYDAHADAVHHRWGTVFGIASFLTPFFQGMILGALTTSQIRVVDDQVVTGFFAGWTTPFAISCGLFALGLFAFLAATYLTLDTQADPEVQNDFRLRALWSGVSLAPIAAAVFFVAEEGAPIMYHGLTRPWAPMLLFFTSIFAMSALWALWQRKFHLARVSVISQVTLILVGWSLAQYPHLITPDVTISDSHAPEPVLRLLLLALGLGSIILLPSLGFLYHLFKGENANRAPSSHDF